MRSRKKKIEKSRRYSRTVDVKSVSAKDGKKDAGAKDAGAKDGKKDAGAKDGEKDAGTKDGEFGIIARLFGKEAKEAAEAKAQAERDANVKAIEDQITKLEADMKARLAAEDVVAANAIKDQITGLRSKQADIKAGKKELSPAEKAAIYGAVIGGYVAGRYAMVKRITDSPQYKELMESGKYPPGSSKEAEAIRVHLLNEKGRLDKAMQKDWLWSKKYALRSDASKDLGAKLYLLDQRRRVFAPGNFDPPDSFGVAERAEKARHYEVLMLDAVNDWKYYDHVINQATERQLDNLIDQRKAEISKHIGVIEEAFHRGVNEKGDVSGEFYDYTPTAEEQADMAFPHRDLFGHVYQDEPLTATFGGGLGFGGGKPASQQAAEHNLMFKQRFAMGGEAAEDELAAEGLRSFVTRTMYFL